MAHPTKLRILVIEAHKNGEGTYDEIARRFSVGRASVSRWLRKERESGQVSPGHGGGMPPTIDSSGVEMFLEILSENGDLTQSELADAYTEQTGTNVSPSVVKRLLKKLGITRKKKTVRATQQDNTEVQQQRQDFFEMMSWLPFEDLVFLDEMGINVQMTRSHARSLRGTRAFDTVPGGHAKNVSVVGTITLHEGVSSMMAIDGAFDGPTFLAYLNEVLVPTLRKDQIVVMDNVQFHKIPGVIETLESAGAVVFYQPAYSPDLNPIEECWSKVKAILRRLKARTRDALLDALSQAADAVTPQDVNGWFAHCLLES